MALVSVEYAQEYLLDDAVSVAEFQHAPLKQCFGAVIADDLVSTINVPPCDNSAMDGYAIRIDDLKSERLISVTQKIFAGANADPLHAGEAARIFTGASVPIGADAVVMQENCEEVDGNLKVLNEPRKADHIRPLGQDVSIGDTVLCKGTRLNAQQIGVAASLGNAKLPVFRPLKAAILSTGDELLEPGMPAAANKIYNSNRYQLSALLNGLGIDVLDAGIVADDLATTRTQVTQLASQVDVIISSGGVSVGEADFVKNVISELGDLKFWKLAMKPGKPLAYGRVSGTPYFGLPGNPVSAFATFLIMVKPYLLKMQGCTEGLIPKPVAMTACFDWPKAGTRQEYLRSRIQTTDSGENQLLLHDNQSSGVLSSVSWADGFAVVAPGQTIAIGEQVNFLPFEGLLS